MATIVSRSLAMIITLVVTAVPGQADQTEGGLKSDNPLVGTWKLVSAKYGGSDFTFPEGTTTVKHVTPTQFMWATYDGEGTVSRAAGGRYTLKGETYEETPEYGISADFDVVKGKPQTFKWKVKGNKWYHDGKLSNGQTIEEVWERVERR